MPFTIASLVIDSSWGGTLNLGANLNLTAEWSMVERNHQLGDEYLDGGNRHHAERLRHGNFERYR